MNSHASTNLTAGLLVLGMALVAAPRSANGQALHVDASIEAEVERPAAGDTVRVALRLAPQQGWHTYWENPGDAGMPTRIVWTLPKGVRATDLRHPAPTAINTAGFVSYVHEGTVALLTSLKLDRNWRPGQALPLIADVSWAACSENQCIPERTSIKLDLVISDGTARPTSTTVFQQAAAELPRQLPRPATLRLVDGGFEMILPAVPIDASRAHFFPAENAFPGSTKQSVRKAPEGIVVRISHSGPLPPVLAGVVADSAGRAFRIEARAAPLTAAVDKPDGHLGASAAAAATAPLSNAKIVKPRTAQPAERLAPAPAAISVAAAPNVGHATYLLAGLALLLCLLLAFGRARSVRIPKPPLALRREDGGALAKLQPPL
ncbi:protein-disulfide reductase DsbD domain-containing protein [Sphingosinicella sp. BN140058]|uniref:protein-disulfide reductase DsbD domain-containing protein n=1 Tax=Sphingosinicella sp. BN140058 TaxID=1892855 RepID=UPI001010E9D0|nr:protein-disulfide reductase DsbD domain-containing protein [Sphingosinicella sp. BN140058]QAY80363.1 hypothetical protein ETR14_27365 [Sphingosinicella sp. BN140058]